MKRLMLSYCAGLSATFLVSAHSLCQELEWEQPSVEALPDHLQANLEIRDREMNQLVAGSDLKFSVDFVVATLKSWLPGQVVTVAFQGGDYELRKRISETAQIWTQHANLTLDFGHDTARKSFREWNTADEAYKADIRISFNYAGYWSLVGTDSTNSAIVSTGDSSMNFGGFPFSLPADWQGTVLHEFGHALGFHHEHQHPIGGCDSQFKWFNDSGYILTRNASGGYIQDSVGRKPGIYTVLGGSPNNWPKDKVDRNLKQLLPSTPYHTSAFDPDSIMKYYFPDWMFVDGSKSFCFTPKRRGELSPGDISGAQTIYPSGELELRQRFETHGVILQEMQAMNGLSERLEQGLDALQADFQSLNPL